MQPEKVRDLYEATERSWESTAAQWVTVFDAVTNTGDGSLGPIEEAVWDTYTRTRQLRKLVASLWLDAQTQSREVARRDKAEAQAGREGDQWIVE